MTQPATHSPAPAGAPSSGGAIRLLVLLGLLAIVVSAWAYDYFVAAPGSENTYKKIQEMVDAKNAKGVRAGGVVRSKDVQEIVGFAPTWVEEKKDHKIEWYCWWGKIPVLSTWKRYITVVYYGDQFNTHHQNEPPPAEALPGYLESLPIKHIDQETYEKMPKAGMPGPGMRKAGPGGGGRGGPGGGPPPETAEGGATKADKPAETPSEGDKPAEAPKTGDKPAEAPSDSSKPAEPPKEGDKPAESPKTAEKPSESPE